MSKSKIEWTDATWNPIAGCSKVSAGCKHCYAERMAKRCAAMGQAKYAGTVDEKGHWTGQINFDEAALVAPLGWKNPRMVFVNSMSDLFHPEVPDEWVDRVFAVMALCPQHVFQVLTKRPERMALYFKVIERRFRSPRSFWSHIPQEHHDRLDENPVAWPLPNVWLGVSVENQEQADKRIPLLLECPAAVRFLSCEPLLGAVDVSRWLVKRGQTHISVSVAGALRNKAFYGFTDSSGKLMSKAAAKAELLRLQANGVECIPMGECDDFDPKEGCRGHSEPRVDWLICGGESGPGKDVRTMHPDWARGLRDQCVVAGVPFFFKQWGNFAAVYDRDTDPGWHGVENVKAKFPGGRWVNLEGGHGFHGDRVHWMVPVNKKAAGRLLDGREWNEMPGVVGVTP